MHFRGSYGSLCVLNGPYRSLLAFMGPYGSLCVLIGLSKSL